MIEVAAESAHEAWTAVNWMLKHEADMTVDRFYAGRELDGIVGGNRLKETRIKRADHIWDRLVSLWAPPTEQES